MNETKYKIGDEVTVSRVRGPHKIEAVKEQYYIRDEGWFDACALTPYVRPLQVGDPVRLPCYHRVCEIVAIAGAYAWVKSRGDSSGGGIVTPLAELVRIPEEAA